MSQDDKIKSAVEDAIANAKQEDVHQKQTPSLDKAVMTELKMEKLKQVQSNETVKK